MYQIQSKQDIDKYTSFVFDIWGEGAPSSLFHFSLCAVSKFETLFKSLNECGLKFSSCEKNFQNTLKRLQQWYYFVRQTLRAHMIILEIAPSCKNSGSRRQYSQLYHYIVEVCGPRISESKNNIKVPSVRSFVVPNSNKMPMSCLDSTF